MGRLPATRSSCPAMYMAVTSAHTCLLLCVTHSQANDHEKETAGFVLSFFLQAGILLGSFLQPAVKHFN